MRSIITLGLVMSLISLLSGCSDNEEALFEKKHSSASDQIQKQGEISSFDVITNHINSMCGTGTRSDRGFQIETHCIENDTVMYIVNYDNGGWDAYSAKMQAPMLLMSAEDGNLNLADSASIPPAFLAVINRYASNIHNLDDRNDLIEESWQQAIMGMSVSNGFLPRDTTYLDTLSMLEFQMKFIQDSIQMSRLLGRGYWQCDTLINDSYINTIDHLVADHWNQLEPYNQYIPLDSENPSLHSATGCCTVATAQFLHYLHLKDGITPRAYSQWRYEESENKYYFSNLSGTIWDHLPADVTCATSNEIDNLALVMGYISSCVCYNHTRSATSGTMARISWFLRDSCNLSYVSEPYDNVYVVNKIKNHYPVITTALGKNNGQNDYHCFLLDAYGNHRTAIVCVMKWVGLDAHGNPTNTWSSNGEPTTFRYELRKPISIVENDCFKMNIGRGVSYYDNTWLNASDRWFLKSSYWYDPVDIIKEF